MEMACSQASEHNMAMPDQSGFRRPPGPLPAWAGEDHVCPDCMLDYQELALGAAMGLICQTSSEVRAVLEAVPRERLRRRPALGAWSVAEYTCHLREFTSLTPSGSTAPEPKTCQR